jgi:hypothetical protein
MSGIKGHVKRRIEDDDSPHFPATPCKKLKSFSSEEAAFTRRSDRKRREYHKCNPF